MIENDGKERAERRRFARAGASAAREPHVTNVLRAVRNVNQLIIREKDRNVLLAKVCGILTGTRGYRSAWIAATGDQGTMLSVDASGVGAPLDALREMLRQGRWPMCAQRAFASGNVMVFQNPKRECGECPLIDGYRGAAALAARLRHDGHDYGVLTVSLPRAEASVEEEQSLVAEVAGDLALALHTLAMEAAQRASAVREAHLKQVLLAIRNVNQLIVHESDPQRLIERACANLTETLGYFNAWIALLDDEGKKAVTVAVSGFAGGFDSMRERLARGAFPACMQHALACEVAIVVDAPSVNCTDCLLSGEYGGRAGFTQRLAFEGRLYGILAVSVPASFAQDTEEQNLFSEVAGDLGFALHKIELQSRLNAAQTEVRAKLNALLAPEGDLGEVPLTEVLDIPAVQRMMDDFYGLTGMGMAILDLSGGVLVATGWQDICTKFHRIHPESRRNCIASDTILSKGVEPGSFNSYRCKNNLWDIATPIMLGGRHAGNLFLGQFIFEDEEPDREIFRAQARRYGFDEDQYLAALDRLPRWSRAQVDRAMTFYTAFAGQLSDLSYGNIRLARTLAQRDMLLGQLQRNEERLRLALRATNDVVWDWDIVNDSQMWNEAGAVVFGWIDIIETPQTAAWWVERVHPEDRARVDKAFFEAVETPGAERWQDEYRFRKANGAYAYVLDRGYILRNANGHAVRMIGAMLDVTGPKCAEEDLRRGRDLLDAAEQLSSTGGWEWNVVQQMMTWTSGTYRIHDLDPVAAPAGSPKHIELSLACYDAEDRKRVSDAFQRCIAHGEDYDLECGFTSAAGRRLRVRTIGRAIRENGRTVKVMGTIQDVTEDRRRETELRVSKETAHALLNAANDCVFLMEPDGRILVCNDETARRLGRPGADLTGMNMYDLLPPDAASRRKQWVTTVARTGQPLRDEDQRAGRILNNTVYPLFGETGQVSRVAVFSRDITAYRDAEAQLEFQAHLLRNIRDLVAATDLSGCITYVNDAACRAFGRTRDKLLGATVHVFENDTLLGASQDEIIRCTRVEGQWTGMIVNRAGIAFEVRTQLMYDATGTPYGIVSISTDVTEKSQAEDALRESEERFRAANDASLDALLLLNSIRDETGEIQDFVFVDLNRRTEEMLQMSRERLLGKRLCEELPINREAGFFEKYKHVVATGIPLEEEFFLPETHVPAAWYYHQVVRVGDGIFICHRDIGERKRAEEALWHSREVLRAVLDNIPARVFWKDLNLKYLGANVSFARDAGFDSPSDLIGQDDFVMAWRDQAELYRKDDRSVIESGTGRILYEETKTTPKGGTIHLLTSKVPLRDTQGTVRGVLGVYIDITGRKHAEAERENLQAQLRQAQKMEAVGRLAGGVAHDFNNMLGIIIGHTDILLEQVKPDLPVHADLIEIRKAGERSADLTRQLLAFARKQTIAPIVVSLNESVAGMLKMLHRLIGEDIDMMWIPDKNVWPVKIDPGQVDHILANLCVNARDAISGVGKLTIETGNSVFDAAYCRDHAGFVPGEYAMLAVSDNGSGIDSETMPHLFEPFFTTKAQGKGTGLGLATVYGVVKQNNGLINVYSEPGQGTTFKIYLPRHLDKKIPLPEKRPDTPTKQGHETVLVVEDEPAVLRMITRILEHEGYTVVVAGTPGDAIRLSKEHAGDIHILISDVVMPEMNGRDLAKNILSLYPALKCLFMSGFTANVIAHHGVLDEGVNFIQKPFSRKEVVAKVRQVLDKE